MIFTPRFRAPPCPQPAVTAQTNQRHRADHAATATIEPDKTVWIHRHFR